MTTHLVIPDTQVKPGVPTDNLRWFGMYAAEKMPDVIVHLGDHWDMPSLSSYDKGKRAMEGRRYRADVQAGNDGMALLNAGIEEGIAKTRRGKRGIWRPRRILLRGNHEQRIIRATEMDAALDGTIGYYDLESPGWDVYDFLEVVDIDGVCYSHYYANRGTGKPLGGMAMTRLKQLGHTFIQGHQQTLEVATRFVLDKQQWGIVAGAAYLHDEYYLGYQGNHHWRGILRLASVKDGSFDPMFISLDSLCRRYEGMSLSRFMERYS